MRKDTWNRRIRKKYEQILVFKDLPLRVRVIVVSPATKQMVINPTATQSDFIKFIFIKWLKENTWFTKGIQTRTSHFYTLWVRELYHLLLMHEIWEFGNKTIHKVINNNSHASIPHYYRYNLRHVAWIRVSLRELSNFTIPNNLRIKTSRAPKILEIYIHTWLVNSHLASQACMWANLT